MNVFKYLFIHSFISILITTLRLYNVLSLLRLQLLQTKWQLPWQRFLWLLTLPSHLLDSLLVSHRLLGLQRLQIRPLSHRRLFLHLFREKVCSRLLILIHFWTNFPFKIMHRTQIQKFKYSNTRNTWVKLNELKQSIRIKWREIRSTCWMLVYQSVVESVEYLYVSSISWILSDVRDALDCLISFRSV